MNLFGLIRERWHPLHRARQWRWFQAAQNRWDPIIRVRLPFFRTPVYVRLLAHGAYWLGSEKLEENIRKTMVQWMKSPEGTRGFWDVGANIGMFSLLYANAHPDCPLLSFEPDRRNLECLRRTMSVWNLASHKLIPAAVSDHTGKAAFSVDRLSGATGTLVLERSTFNEQQYNVKGQTETVDLVRLDNFYLPNAPGLIKIDVEGAEVAVLRGGARVLEEASPVLLFESFDQGEDCRRLLSTYGYSFFDSDRCEAASNETTNFLALVLDKASEDLKCLLREIGYPL
jgi:FkbM family methyltransferase